MLNQKDNLPVVRCIRLIFSAQYKVN